MSFNILVAIVLNVDVGWGVNRFKRTLCGDLLTYWLKIKNNCVRVVTIGDSDNFLWDLTRSGKLTVSSLYTMLEVLQMQCPFRRLLL